MFGELNITQMISENASFNVTAAAFIPPTYAGGREFQILWAVTLNPRQCSKNITDIHDFVTCSNSGAGYFRFRDSIPHGGE